MKKFCTTQSKIAVGTLAAVLALAGPAFAQPLTWTGPAGTTASPVGGLWDTTSFNWNNGASAVAFASAVNGAVFGGVDGVYAIECTNLTATNIIFNASGYTLENPNVPVTVTVAFGSSAAQRGLSVAAGKTATIGTNVTLLGASAPNPWTFNAGTAATGTLVIDNGGTLSRTGNQQYNFDGGPGSTIRILPGGTFVDSRNGSQLRMGITANSSPTISVEGGQFLLNQAVAGGPSIILGAGNSTTSTISLFSGVVSNTLATASITLGNGVPSLATFNLNGGTLAVKQIVKTAAGATGVLNLNGGTIRAFLNNAALLASTTNLTVNVRTNNSTIDNNNLAISITQPLVHSTIGGDNATDGGLTFAGGGTTTLTATNTYTGPTFVQGGTLNLGVATSSINNSSLIGIGTAATNGTLVLSNRVFQTAGTFAMTNGMVQLQIFNFPTNIVAGTLALGGTSNMINIPIIVGGGVIPQTTPLIKYTTLAPGAVDGNNNLTTLGLGILPNGFTGYLTNDVAKSTIDLVLTAGSLAPYVAAQPVSLSRYAGATVQFSVTAFGQTYTHWRLNGNLINDGGNISGTTTGVLTISNLTVANAGNYDVVLTNTSGTSFSSVATLTVVTPTSTYESAMVSNSPVAYYRLNENSDTVSAPNFTLPFYDYAGGFDGLYGSTVLNQMYGIYGPQPTDGYPGFEAGNGAVQFTPGSAYAGTSLNVISNALPVNTNTVTLMAWVYPLTQETNFAGLIFNRGTNVAGLGYSGSTDVNGDYTLGYNWNNDSNTYGWNSGLVPPLNQWSLVALVITSTNATIYVANTNGIASSVHTYPHPVQALTGPLILGDDTAGAGGVRIFNGNMDEVAIFNYALSSSAITTMLTAASGLTNFPPVILTQPVSQTAVVGDNIQFSVTTSGTAPLSYQWEVGTNGVYVNLADDGHFVGSQTASLSINNLALGDPTNFIVVVTNAAGSITSSPASLTVQASRTVVTLNAGDASGVSSINTAGNWSNASAPAYANDYLVNSNLLRTPASGNFTFAGHSLTLISNATLAFKTTGILTVGSNAVTGLTLDGANVGGWNGSPSTLAGYVTLAAGGGSMDPQVFSVLNLTAKITGPGALSVSSSTSQFGGTVALLSSNSYTGGTFIYAVDTLKLTSPGTLGAINGSLTMNVTQGVTSSSTRGTLDLNGTSQGVGNLSGNGSAVILNSATSTTNTLTIGNDDATGGNFQGTLSSGAGVLGLVKVGAGTLTLSGTNTYVGSTWINRGTLAVSGGGLLGGTPTINLAAGATLDVSGATPVFSLGAGQAIVGAGATGIINGSVNVNNGSLTLNYASSTPTLSVANGTLTLNNNAVTVTNLGAALPVGSYKIVAAGSGGSVAGVVAGSTVTVAGGGVAAGKQGSLTITGGELYLTVGTPGNPVFSVTNTWNGLTLTLSWPGGGQLLQTTNLAGPWTTNNSAASPFTVSPTGPQMFYRVQQ